MMRTPLAHRFIITITSFALAAVASCNPSSARTERIIPASATGVGLPSPAEPTPAFPPQRSDVARRVTASWNATVVAAPGLAEGAPCTINIALDRFGREGLRSFVDIVCGSTVIYRPIDGNGARRIEADCQVGEQSPREGEPSQLSLLCGFVPGGPVPQRAWIDTIRGIATVRDFEHSQTFEFHVEPWSTPVSAPAITLACRPPSIRSGHVSDATPSAPFAPNAPCTIATMACDGATPGVPHCRAEIRCGGVALYGGGATGRIACESNGAPLRASDFEATPIDGDPRLDMDLTTGRIIVSDTTDDERWSNTIALDPIAAAPVAR